MAETSICRVPACGMVVAGRVARCPRCGSLTFSARQTRVRGAVLLACGVLLVGLIASTPTLARIFLGPTVAFSLPADRIEALLLLAPIGFVVLFGLVAAIAGAWQAAMARPLRNLHVVLVAILMAIMLVCGLAAVLFGGDGPGPLPPRFGMP